jgi:hypothetical protein
VLSLREALVGAKKINKHVKCQCYHGLAFFSASYSHPPSCVTAVPLSVDHSERVEWSYLPTLVRSMTATIRSEFDQKLAA